MPGYLAGSLAEYLGIGVFDWQTPMFDTSFAASGGASRYGHPQENPVPGIANANKTDANFSIYPNPTNGNFIVNCDAGSLSIMSIDGRTLKQYELGDGKTTLVLPPGLAAGIYMLKYVAAGDKASSLTRLVYQP